MDKKQSFLETIQKSYSFKGETIKLGGGILGADVIPNADIYLPLAAMNRHGLIAGATGSGKTKTLQVLAESFSDASVPVLLMDIKGDLSGLAAEATLNDKITDRAKLLNLEYKPIAYPVELLSLTDSPGVRLRATVSEFGPVLLSKILGLNDTQGGVVALIFKYCDDHKLPLLDLKDFVKVLQYLSNEGKKEIEKEYGKIAGTTTGTILRKVVELQQQGADSFFGEKSFEVSDLMRIADDGRGMISILKVTELQDRPKMFSTFMLQLLAELYAISPEEGDLDKPKLVLFIDEAHLVFKDATDVLIDQIETVIKLIRSKGIGVFFCTQNPSDIPTPVLSQLGLKVQHALRAFTATDRKSIKLVAENYPDTIFYETNELITQLGTGEALVTTLNEKGIPTPLVHVMIVPPKTRMDILSENEINTIVSNSKLVSKYNAAIDTRSAHEILSEKLASAAESDQSDKTETKKAGSKQEKTWMDNPMVRSAGRTAVTMITRSLLGVLGLGGSTRRKRTRIF